MIEREKGRELKIDQKKINNRKKEGKYRNRPRDRQSLKDKEAGTSTK